MVLYDSPVSGNCYKIRLLLAHLGVRYERHDIDVIDRSGRAETLGALNPALRIPVLVLDDGRSLAESNAILVFLAENTDYLPDDRFTRAKVLQWMFFEQYSHEPHIAVARFWLTIANHEPSADELAAKHASGYAALDAMERQLTESPFLAGASYTISDIALYAYTHVASEGGFDLTNYPAVATWIERVARQPGHVQITA